ncbi:hypothetical protein VTL71DRAFT_13410 [Oculimacula yallundae]|uniref:Uncharacterized protein n=1 Tax=Oculimacula yallundae TaxID=86028 RepID=A0ABR4CML2_9HELO
MDEPPGPLTHLTVAVIVLRQCMPYPFKPISTLVAQRTILEGIGVLKIATLLGLLFYGLKPEFYSQCPINWMFAKPVLLYEKPVMSMRIMGALAWFANGHVYSHNFEHSSVGKERLTSTMDSMWRRIIEIGVIPAVIALCFRLSIIESPEHTADIDQEHAKAGSESYRCFLIPVQKVEVTSAANPSYYTQFEISEEEIHGIEGNHFPLPTDTISQARLRDDFALYQSHPIPDLDCLSSNLFSGSERRLRSSISTTPSKHQRLQNKDRKTRMALSRESDLSPDGLPPCTLCLINPEPSHDFQHASLPFRGALFIDWLRTITACGQLDHQSTRVFDPRSTVNHGLLRSLSTLQKMP